MSEDIKSVERPEFIGAPDYWMDKVIRRCREALENKRSKNDE